MAPNCAGTTYGRGLSPHRTREAAQNERIDRLIAAAEAVLRPSVAVTGKHVRDELERGPCEPPTQNVAQLELGRAISAALENIRDREAVRRTINSLDKSVSDALVTYHRRDEQRCREIP